MWLIVGMCTRVAATVLIVEFIIRLNLSTVYTSPVRGVFRLDKREWTLRLRFGGPLARGGETGSVVVGAFLPTKRPRAFPDQPSDR